MTVRNAVARRDQAVATTSQNPAKTLAQVAEQAIANQEQMLDAVLPQHVDRKRFAAMTLAAVRATPDLAACFGTREGAASFLIAASQAAIVGLEPNTPTQECWILPRRAKVDGQWRQEAQLTIGYRGILKLARRGAGDVKEVFAEVVHEHDEFEWWRGLEADHLRHRPASGDRGEMTHAYAVARYQAGGVQFIVLDETEVHSRRARSDSWKSDQKYNTSYSPWNTSTRAMWQKSAIRALAPYLDLTAEAAEAVAQDDTPTAFDAGAIVTRAEDAVGELPAAAEVAGAEPPEPAEPAAGPVPLATQRQLTAVNTLLGQKYGATGDARFPLLAAPELLGRDIESTSELTKAEAARLIDQLGALPDHEQAPDDGVGTEPM